MLQAKIIHTKSQYVDKTFNELIQESAITSQSKNCTGRTKHRKDS